MRHFYRTQLTPDDVLSVADTFFPNLELGQTEGEHRLRRFSGPLGALVLTVKKEGGHYTFVEVHTDQMGESRLDRNVKAFFVDLHRAEHARHALQAAY